MANGNFISYIRVSTQMQGASGLGLDAQQQAIRNYLNGGTWQLLAEYVEIESGKNNDRPQLKAALHQCSITGATLIIAKLDRLSRNVSFISQLMDSRVDFVAVDFPTANRLTIHILAAVAEHERAMCSERTKVALKAAKARGQKLGNPENLNAEGQAKGSKAGVLINMIKADSFALEMQAIIKHHQSNGLNLSQVAEKMNQAHILTARGYNKAGQRLLWTAQAVKNVMLRVVS